MSPDLDDPKAPAKPSASQKFEAAVSKALDPFASALKRAASPSAPAPTRAASSICAPE